MRRREFIAGLGGAAVAWPLAARAQQPAHAGDRVRLRRVGRCPAGYVAAFRKGLGETGYVEGQNVTVEYHWLEGQYDRLPALMADLVRRRVAVIATPGSKPPRSRPKLRPRRSRSCSASAMTRSSLVLSPASPGRAATRPASIFSTRRWTAKRLGLLHELVPKAVRVAVLVNPANATTTETTLREVQEAARTIGLQIQILNASYERRDRCGLCHPCARAARCPLRRWRRILQQPPRANCHLGGARQDSGGLCES